MSEHSIRLSYPFQLGVYLAVNALPDAFLLIDGADCSLSKMEFVCGKHDLNSTLFSADGRHRIAATGATCDRVVHDREAEVTDLLCRVARQPGARRVFLSALTMCGITGVDYARVAETVRRRCRKDVWLLPCDSLDKSWLDGYASVLANLARNLPLRRAAKSPRNVAVVGHLLDRNEGDALGNADELRRMLRSLGLYPVSVWLDGSDSQALGRIASCSVIVSLPYAREAARILAERTGARLLESDLPFGLADSIRWLKAVARHTGRERQVQRVVDAELRRIVPRLKWIVPRFLVNRRLGYVGDPHLFQGFAGFAEEMGIRVPWALLTGRAEQPLVAGGAGTAPLVLQEPDEGRVLDALRPAGACDLIVSNTWGAEFLGPEFGPHLELGFLSTHTHYLTPRPYLGFTGCLSIIERIMNSLLRVRMDRDLGGGGGCGGGTPGIGTI